MDAAPSPARPPEPPAETAWPRSAQVAAAFLLGIALTLLCVHAYGYLPAGCRPTQLQSGASLGALDLNRADRAELLQLPGVGPALADRIEAYRRDHGGFRSPEDLRHVPGVGPNLLALLRPCVTTNTPSDDGGGVPVSSASLVSRAEAPAAPSPSKKAAALTGLIDVNRASADELQKLPGIGPKMSQAIVQERERGGPFKSADDLRRVRGIGPKTLERLRPLVTAGGGGERLVSAEN